LAFFGLAAEPAFGAFAALGAFDGVAATGATTVSSVILGSIGNFHLIQQHENERALKMFFN
jgi:hypothetical protein